MKIKSIFSLTYILIFYLTGCATILNTTTTEVELITSPTNAKITIDGKKFGNSPQVVNIERGINHTIKFELEGFEPYETQLTRKISLWFWGNVFNGLLPGMIIDFLTGSMYNLIPDNLSVELLPAKIETKVKKK